MAKAKNILPPTSATVPHLRDGFFVGIDQSFTNTGVVILNEYGEHVSDDLVQTEPPTSTMGEVERFLKIYNEIQALIRHRVGDRPVGIALEDFAYGKVQKMADIGGLGWFLRIMFSRTSWSFCVAAPTLLKKVATGKGVASKTAVCMGVMKRWKFETDNDNLADAFVLAKIAWIHYGRPIPGTKGLRNSDFEAVKKLKTYK